MSLRFASLNSGSNGNCYFVGDDKEGILVDVGISAKALLARLNHLGIALSEISAIFISHEHSDHIKGLETLCKKQQIPVYISKATYARVGALANYPFTRFFTDGDTVILDNISVHCFSKIHDAVDPYSFTISVGGKKVGVFTDLGAICSNLTNQFRICDVIFLESNYDSEMLQSSSYPYYLKERIRGGRGHLSNDQALDLFRNAKNDGLTHLFLSHLSKNNNCPHKVMELFAPFADNIHLQVASRDVCSELFTIPLADNSKQHVCINKQFQLF